MSHCPARRAHAHSRCETSRAPRALPLRPLGRSRPCERRRRRRGRPRRRQLRARCHGVAPAPDTRRPHRGSLQASANARTRPVEGHVRPREPRLLPRHAEDDRQRRLVGGPADGAGSPRQRHDRRPRLGPEGSQLSRDGDAAGPRVTRSTARECGAVRPRGPCSGRRSGRRGAGASAGRTSDRR